MERIKVPHGSSYEKRVVELSGADMFAIARECGAIVGEESARRACKISEAVLASAVEELDRQLKGPELVIALATIAVNAIATTAGNVDAINMRLQAQEIEDNR